MVNSVPSPDPLKALEYKESGNKCFQAGDYVGAEDLYSKAIKYDPTNPVLYTNLAMSLLKLSHYNLVIPAAQVAISLAPDNMKAYFQLGQAHIALNNSKDALSSGLLAHKYCVEEIQRGGKGGSSIGPITELVLRCKKLDWERRENQRLRERQGLLVELVERLQGAKDMEVLEASTSGTGPEGIRELENEWDAKIELLRSTFDSAAGNESESKRREVPDWCVDDITFSVMLDPVVTKTGQSYDRSSIMEHLKRSPTDPLTREPLRVEDLRPNLALRQACEEFLDQNGWAVDW